MSELKTNKISPATLTEVVLGDDGDTFTIPSGVTVTNSGTATGFGKVVQVVNVMDGAVATGTTLMVHDDSIAQITEGDEYMTLAITPTSATNKLLIQVVTQSANSVAGRMYTSLFQDSTANALATVSWFGDANVEEMASLNYYMTTGTASATTFRVRIGNQSAGTTTFNGDGGARKQGGVYASSITITEISA